MVRKAKRISSLALHGTACWPSARPFAATQRPVKIRRAWSRVPPRPGDHVRSHPKHQVTFPQASHPEPRLLLGRFPGLLPHRAGSKYTLRHPGRGARTPPAAAGSPKLPVSTASLSSPESGTCSLPLGAWGGGRAEGKPLSCVAFSARRCPSPNPCLPLCPSPSFLPPYRDILHIPYNSLSDNAVGLHLFHVFVRPSPQFQSILLTSRSIPDPSGVPLQPLNSALT